MTQRQAQKKPVPEKPESSLRRWLKERNITEVECLVPDITGIARGKIIPADKFSHDYGTRLPEGIFATTGRRPASSYASSTRRNTLRGARSCGFPSFV